MQAYFLVPKDLVVADSMESFGIGVELNVAMVLSWLPLISDYTCNVNKPVKGSVISVLSYSLGSMIMFSIGLLASIVFQESDISNIIIKMGLGGMGLFIVIFLRSQQLIWIPFLLEYVLKVLIRTGV